MQAGAETVEFGIFFSEVSSFAEPTHTESSAGEGHAGRGFGFTRKRLNVWSDVAYAVSILAAIHREVCSFTPTEQSQPPGITLNFIIGCYETARKKKSNP